MITTIHALPEAQHIVGSEVPLAPAQKGSLVHADSFNHHGTYVPEDYAATEEMSSLRRVAGKIPITAYVHCTVEFAERGSFYGVKQVFSNFVNR